MNVLQQRLRVICVFSAIFETAFCEKGLKNYKHNRLHLARKYVRIFVFRCYLFLEAYGWYLLGTETLTIDKHSKIFSRQMEATAYL